MPFSLFKSSKSQSKEDKSVKPASGNNSSSQEIITEDNQEENIRKPASELTRMSVVESLARVIDPEIGLNIVDLGLIYDVQVEPGRTSVKMTMTTPACPMGDFILQQVKRVLGQLPAHGKIQVELTWQPCWSPEMIEPDARAGLFAGFRR